MIITTLTTPDAMTPHHIGTIMTTTRTMKAIGPADFGDRF